MFKNFYLEIIKKQIARRGAVNAAREKFILWREISVSPGFKVYTDEIDRRIEGIRKKMEDSTDLTGEDLKRLQLALQVYKEVKRIPSDLKSKAKGS